MKSEITTQVEYNAVREYITSLQDLYYTLVKPEVRVLLASHILFVEEQLTNAREKHPEWTSSKTPPIESTKQ